MLLFEHNLKRPLKLTKKRKVEIILQAKQKQAKEKPNWKGNKKLDSILLAIGGKDKLGGGSGIGLLADRLDHAYWPNRELEKELVIWHEILTSKQCRDELAKAMRKSIRGG